MPEIENSMALPGTAFRVINVCMLGSCGDDSKPAPLPPVNVIDFGSTTHTAVTGSVTIAWKAYFPLLYGT